MEPTIGSHREPASERLPAAALPFEDLAASHAAYEARVFRFLLYSIRDRDDAMTITQDTFLTAWKTRASFRGECSELTWLIRIAISLLRNHVRTQRFKFWRNAEVLESADLLSPIVDPNRTPEQRVSAQQELTAVLERVEQLSAKQKTVFLLRFVDELDLSEIAIATDLPLSTVKTHLYRALDHVRAVRQRKSETEISQRGTQR